MPMCTIVYMHKLKKSNQNMLICMSASLCRHPYSNPVESCY